MADEPQTLKLANLGYTFDHPEAVAWGPDGRAYAGGEAGQLYRFGLDGKKIEEIARVEGGFLLGLAHDANANTYACDDRSGCVHRITPGGEVSTYANGNAGQKMRVPNYPVFDDHGNLYVSDSGTWDARDGFIWKVAPGGKAAIWDRQANGFTNGMCLSADGRWLLSSNPVLPSYPASRSRPTAAPAGARSSSSCRVGCLTASPSTLPATSISASTTQTSSTG